MIEKEYLLELGFIHECCSKFVIKRDGIIYNLYNGEDEISLDKVILIDSEKTSVSILLFKGKLIDLEDFKIVLKRFNVI